MTRVYVGLGSNVDKEIHVGAACAQVRAAYGDVIESSLYESPAEGFDGDDFHNMVISFDTEDSLQNIDTALGEIETRQGRVRGKDRYVSRTMDLDVLLFGDEVIRKDGQVMVPRTEITEHEFVLGPLVEICGDLVHPLLHTPIRELWRKFQQENPTRMRRVSKSWG